MKLLSVKFAILVMIIVSVSLYFVSCEDTNEDKMHISTGKEHYELVLGERVNLDIAPKGDYEVSSSDSSIVLVHEDNSIEALGIGDATITIKKGDIMHSVKANIYDRIVSKEYIEEYADARHVPTLTLALQNVSHGEHILVKSGRYDESISVYRDVYLMGEDSTYLRSISVAENVALVVDNISFYSRDYLGEDNAFVEAESGSRVTIRYSHFFIDRKSDLPRDRKGGYAIYVRSNSSFVNVLGSEFTGFRDAIYIESTSGDISITRCKFSALNKGIILDIRDLNSALPHNLPATGKIVDNTFYDVEREVDFLYAGPSYDGSIIIEKHDKL